MAASLKGLDPELKRYLHKNRLPDMYEALLTGIAVVCPDDPYQYIIECLTCLQQFGYDVLQWDAFVPSIMRPVNKHLMVESYLDSLFNFDNSQPTADMIMTAYMHYNRQLKVTCFEAWMKYHLSKRRRKIDMENKLCRAATHHAHRKMRVALRYWVKWKSFRLGRQSMSFNIIENNFHKSVCRVIFRAWWQVTLDTRKTREYFEEKFGHRKSKRVPAVKVLEARLGRGEITEEDDQFGRGNGEARNDIGDMDRSASVQIFKHLNLADLSKCACVCRSWKEITESPQLWTRINFSQVKDIITDKIASKFLMKSRPYLRHLTLRGVNTIGWESFRAISECKNLQDLNLSECFGVNDEVMRLLAEGCKILLYLNISYTDVTDGGLRALAKGLLNLSYLSLAFCKKISNRGLEYISGGKSAKRLVYIDLSGCTQVSAEGYSHLSKGCTGLKTLVVNECTSLDDNCVRELTTNCRLQDISLLGSPYLSDDAFTSVASGKALRKIRLESNQLVTDASLRTLGKLCSNLTHLYLSDCQKVTDYSLKAVGLCRHLVVLNLADCVRITDTGVRHVAEGPSGPKLRELNLTNCIRVGDMALVNIHKRCHSLTYLSVCYCEHISEAGIELLGQTHSLVALDVTGCTCGDQGLSALGSNARFKDVTLAECVKITDLGLQKFAQQCKDVTRLDLSHCKNITDGAIKNLAFCCRFISVLNLSGCKLLTDQSVQYLSGVCHYLRELDLSACVLITDKAIRYLRKGCGLLRLLTILYCKSITKKAVQKMQKVAQRVIWSDDEVPSYYNY